MKKTILILILTGFILSSFFVSEPQPEYEPGEFSGAVYFYLTGKELPEQGSQFKVDSIKGSATMNLTSTDIVLALKKKKGAVKPMKFFLILVDGKNWKILPLTSKESLIMFDFSNEHQEETMAYFKRDVKNTTRDSLNVQMSQPVEFGSSEMFFNLIRK